MPTTVWPWNKKRYTCSAFRILSRHRGRAEPHLLGSAYVNHIAADDQPEKVKASFGDNYRRLGELKSVYDPTNLFPINANIAPA